MKRIWMKLFLCVMMMFLMTACGKNGDSVSSEKSVTNETQMTEESSNAAVVQSEVADSEALDADGATDIIKTPQDKYNIAKALMRSGDLPAALELLNEIESEIDVSKEIEACLEYADYVGFWKADTYDRLGYGVVNDYLIHVSIPIDMDAEKKSLNIAKVDEDTSYDEKWMFFNYYEEWYEMGLNALIASKTHEPGYKSVVEFNLATGEFKEDYRSFGDTKSKSSTGIFTKEDDSKYTYSEPLYYPKTMLVPTIDSVISGVQYVGRAHERYDGDEVVYSYLISRYDALLAKERFEDYKAYLSKEYTIDPLYIDDEKIVINEDGRTQVTMSVVQDEEGPYGEEDFILDVSIIQKKVVVEKREPAIGMTADEVRQSTWGEPEEINITKTRGHQSEQWVYSLGNYIYLEDGIVTSIQSRK